MFNSKSSYKGYKTEYKVVKAEKKNEVLKTVFDPNLPGLSVILKELKIED